MPGPILTCIKPNSQLSREKEALSCIRRPREGGFHLAPDPNREIVGVVVDVRPFQPLAFLDVALEPRVLRKPEREIALVERELGGVCLPQTPEPPSPSSTSPF